MNELVLYELDVSVGGYREDVLADVGVEFGLGLAVKLLLLFVLRGWILLHQLWILS